MNLWLQVHCIGTDLSAQVVSFDSISYNCSALEGLHDKEQVNEIM